MQSKSVNAVVRELASAHWHEIQVEVQVSTRALAHVAQHPSRAGSRPTWDGRDERMALKMLWSDCKGKGEKRQVRVQTRRTRLNADFCDPYVLRVIHRENGWAA